MPDQTADRGRAVIRNLARPVPFRKGERLLTAGGASDEVLLVESGLLKVLLPGDGVEPLVTLLGRDDLVGEIGVIGNLPRSAHVVAVWPGRALHLAAHRFLQLRAEHEPVRALVDQTHYKRQRDADERQVLLTRDVPWRVVSVLVKWVTAFGRDVEGGRQLVGLSQHDVAAAVSASDKSVELALSALRSAGLLRTSRMSFLVTDMVKLRDLSGH